MKKFEFIRSIMLMLVFLVISVFSFSQIITPTGIEIGDMNQLPNFADNHWDGPVKVVSGNLNNGTIVLKQTNSGKVGAFHVLNSENDAIFMGIGGPDRPYEFEANCAMIKSIEQYGSGNLKYFVIGNRDSEIPIVFVQNEQEVVRIDESGNIEISNPNTGLILTSPNGSKFKITVDDSGNLTTTTATNIAKVENEIEIDIYPNPTENNIKIDLQTKEIQDISVELYDIAGKMVYMKSYQTNLINMDISDFETGTYILKVKNNKGKIIKTEKIIRR